MIENFWTSSDLKTSIVQRIEQLLFDYPNLPIQNTLQAFKENDNIHPLRIQIEDLCPQKNYFREIKNEEEIDFDYYSELYLLDSLITYYIELNTT